jgi:hypothetical protein
MATEETVNMPRSEGQSVRTIHGLPVPPELAEEIERALEMMRRVRTAELAQGKSRVVEIPRSKYLIPKPLVYHVTRSRDGE